MFLDVAHERVKLSATLRYRRFEGGVGSETRYSVPRRREQCANGIDSSANARNTAQEGGVLAEAADVAATR